MTIKERIEQDLKQALLGGDKFTATTLRGIKGVILNAEIESGEREDGLGDEALVGLLAKEAKKRQESAELYEQGGNVERAEAELTEKRLIEAYLPAQLSDEELSDMIDDIIAEKQASGLQAMGTIIGAVKSRTGASADGGRIAKIVKEKLK